MKDDFLDRVDRMERLNVYRPYQPDEGIGAFACVSLIGIGMVMGMVALTGLRACERPKERPVEFQCNNCHSRQAQMTEYFKKAGSKTPEEMAYAVLQTKSPRLLAAIHVKGEKLTPFTIRKGGYKGQHAGAWQMNERLHGKQPYDPTGQALNVEKYLVELADEKPIMEVLSTFGGDSTDKYMLSVLAELPKVS